MTYYFIGGEDFDFSPIGAPSVNTNASSFRSGGWARCSLNAGNGSWRVPASYGLSVTGTFWLTAQMLFTGLTNSTPILQFNGASDVAALRVCGDGSVHTVTGGVDVEVSAGTGPVPYNQLAKMDVEVVFGSSGSITVYFNGDIINQYSGNVTGGQSAIAGFDLEGGASWSEVIWADSDTRPLGLITLVPQANGNANTWDAHNVNNINEIVLNDATSDQSGTATQLDQYTIQSSLPTGNFGIAAVEVVTRAATTATAPQNIQNQVRVGGSNYNSGSFPQGAAFKRNAYIWVQNPNTSANWLQSDLGTGFNIGAESIT